jgi:hypothetical protein
MRRSVKSWSWARLTVAALLLAGFSLTCGAVAQTPSIYKCIDAENHIAFQQTPCTAAQRGQKVEIAPSPVFTTPPDSSKPMARKADSKVITRAGKPLGEAQSFECRTARGAVFYRHSACPKSIARDNAQPVRDNTQRRGTARPSVQTDAVSSRRIPRAEACKNLRSAGRNGRDHDEVIPAYERNLGRDPCRRY